MTGGELRVRLFARVAVALREPCAVQQLIGDALERRHNDDDRLVPGGVEHDAGDAANAIGRPKRGAAKLEDSHRPDKYISVSMDALVREILTSRVYEVARETPLDPAPRLSERLGNAVLLKREDLQAIFSFKIRGAYN